MNNANPDRTMDIHHVSKHSKQLFAYASIEVDFGSNPLSSRVVYTPLSSLKEACD